jgi:putative addiction module component (TIGR02574 family)
MSLEQVAEAALSLTTEERVQLADRLVESLDPAEDTVIRQLWAAKAVRRRDDVRSGKVKTSRLKKALRASAEQSADDI